MKAFLDTTVMTDVLLHFGPPKASAKAALAKYAHSSLPYYALKEFKAGPLKNFMWFHNKLVQNPLGEAFDALNRMARTPRRNTTATAIQAIQQAALSERTVTLDKLTSKYGGQADFTEVIRERFRLAIHRQVLKAWRNRKSVATEVVEPLSCYLGDVPIAEEPSGLLSSEPRGCRFPIECCLAARLRSATASLDLLLKVLDEMERKAEVDRYRNVIKKIKTKGHLMSHKDCVNLGDLYFSLFAPPDSVILTTNIKDHGPLAMALGKSTASP